MKSSKPTTNPAFPSIILTAEAAELIAALGIACSALGAAQPADVDWKYTAYLEAKFALCQYVESLEKQVEMGPIHYTRIRF